MCASESRRVRVYEIWAFTHQVPVGLQSVMVDRLAEFDASALVGVGEIRTWNFHSTPPKRFESLRNSPPLYALKKTVTVTVPLALPRRGRCRGRAAPRIGDRSWYVLAGRKLGRNPTYMCNAAITLIVNVHARTVHAVAGIN